MRVHQERRADQYVEGAKYCGARPKDKSTVVSRQSGMMEYGLQNWRLPPSHALHPRNSFQRFENGPQLFEIVNLKRQFIMEALCFANWLRAQFTDIHIHIGQ